MASAWRFRGGLLILLALAGPPVVHAQQTLQVERRERDRTLTMLAGPVSLPANLDYSDYLGRLAIGRVFEGSLRLGDTVSIVKLDGSMQKTKITKLYSFEGLRRVEETEARPGDILANAAASLRTTPSDYARFMALMVRTPRAPWQISEATRTAMLTKQIQVPGRWTDKGLGWNLEATPRGPVFYHSGSNGGIFKNFATAREHLDGGLKNVQVGYPQFYWEGTPEYADALGRNISKAVTGELSSQQALDEAAEEWTKIVQKLGIDKQKAQYANFLAGARKLGYKI